jgi:NADH-quinone oxidoreductase subunit I
MTDFIEPQKKFNVENSALDINSVPFKEVEQPGPGSLLEQAKGF